MLKTIIIHTFVFLILGFIFLIPNSYATNSVWKDGEFLLWNYGKQYVSPVDFCFALRYENEKIGNPNCYNAGDWERDTIVSMYAKWLNSNLDNRLQTEDLRPRNQHVIERIRSLKDRSLLFTTIKNDKIWFLLFDETSSEPIKLAVFSTAQDSAKIVKKIASDWFGSTPQIRLSDSERMAKQSEPDEYFAEQPMHDVWLGINLGYSRAKVPLTPNSWYKNTLNSEVKNYKEVRDSASVWNFIEDSAPIYSAYIGGSLYDFIGLELGFCRSKHNAKVDYQDPIYEGLEQWYFNRYDFMLSLIFMTVFKPIPQIEIEPHVSASVIYSIYSENIEVSNISEKSKEYYDDRLKFAPYYRGVGLTFGLRTAFFKNYAIDLRTGIANRGAAIQDRFGSSTTDVFVSAGLEYHFRWR